MIDAMPARPSPATAAAMPPASWTDGWPEPETPAGEDLFTHCRPARHFSGDVWFWHRDPDGLSFALGDVAGKGIAAAVFMAMIAEELEHRLAPPARLSLPAVVGGLNETLRREMPANRFASLVVGRLEAGGNLRLVNAGHCPALVRRSSGEVQAVHPTGPVLGVLAGARFEERSLHLGAGETAVLFSDGLLEASSGDGCELGLACIADVLEGAGRLDATGVAAALLAELEDHLAGEPAADDVTLLVVRRPDGISDREAPVPGSGRACSESIVGAL